MSKKPILEFKSDEEFGIDPQNIVRYFLLTLESGGFHSAKKRKFNHLYPSACILNKWAYKPFCAKGILD